MLKRWFCTSFWFIPIPLAAFSPPCEGGVRGGGPRGTMRLVRGSRAAGPRGISGLAENVRYALSTPPDPPFAREGKESLVRHRHSIERNKNAGLETVP